ncbi:MAG TPA: PfkB family carbohydrate kinase [Opitutus sp.]|nr:PfkB family carbohydrate kinase [Opitutus sp.]
MARAGIIAGGNWVVDHVKVIDAWPEQETLATVLDEAWGNGGGPYNVLKNLARLGAAFPREAIGRLGDDAEGRRIRADCAAHGIDVAQLRVTADAPTSYTDVMTVAGSRRRTFFHQRGANARLAPEDFDFSRTPAKWFYLGYLLLLDRLDECAADGAPRARDVFRRARAAGLKTALDCVSGAEDGFRRIVAAVLPEVDVLFANDEEAEKLSGVALGRGAALDRPAVERAAAAILRGGVHEWVIVHFPAGVCACHVAGERLWQPAVKFPAGEIGGTAGAGDALAAGVLLGLHDGWPMARALELGVCAAAASLRHPTCSESVESAAACLALGRRHGFMAG